MGLDFTVLRILVLVGILRILIRGQNAQVRWNRFDYILMAWVICGAVIYVIQFMNTKAIVNRAGFLFDAIGLYWLFRQMIRSFEDIKVVAKILAVCAVILAPLVAAEWLTGHNPFTVLGKVITNVRLGRYRCQAAFPHAIILGLFWATLIPLFIGMAKTQNNKLLYFTAAASAGFITIATASSTPIVVLLLVILLTALFRYRFYARYAVYSIAAMIVAMHIIMNAPVWHLIARINVIGGSTGWHRYYLIDQAISHFKDWVMIGTADTASWGIGLGDVTNQFVLEAVRGGLITLTLFVTLLITAVKTISTYSMSAPSVIRQNLAWCLCVSMVGHCLSFMGVSYFGQIMMLLYVNFAIAGLIYEIMENETPGVQQSVY